MGAMQATGCPASAVGCVGFRIVVLRSHDLSSVGVLRYE